MKWSVVVFFAMALTVDAHAFAPRQCATCREACDRQATGGDKSCCEKVQGMRTPDYCVSNKPDDFVACSKYVVEMRETCKATCDRTTCAR